MIRIYVLRTYRLCNLLIKLKKNPTAVLDLAIFTGSSQNYRILLQVEVPEYGHLSMHRTIAILQWTVG